jgi:Tol biopolymer transport system component
MNVQQASFTQNPSWSVENRLAFALSCGLNWDIFLFSIDDAMNHVEDLEYLNLTHRPNADGVLGLSWSPDGNKIIFVSNPIRQTKSVFV